MATSSLLVRVTPITVALAALFFCCGCGASPGPEPAAPAPSAAPSAASASGAPATPPACEAQVARVWHGKTPNEKADAYDAYIRDAIKKFREIPGNLGYQLMREVVGAETHFSVISYWATRDAIRAYAGDDIRKTRSLPRDPEFLIDLEPTVMNYDLAVVDLGCPGGAVRR